MTREELKDICSRLVSGQKIAITKKTLKFKKSGKNYSYSATPCIFNKLSDSGDYLQVEVISKHFNYKYDYYFSKIGVIII